MRVKIYLNNDRTLTGEVYFNRAIELAEELDSKNFLVFNNAIVPIKEITLVEVIKQDVTN